MVRSAPVIEDRNGDLTFQALLPTGYGVKAPLSVLLPIKSDVKTSLSALLPGLQRVKAS